MTKAVSLFLALLFASSVALAADPSTDVATAVATAPSPSPQLADADFLLLPSHDLVSAGPSKSGDTQASPQVGDEIALGLAASDSVALPQGSQGPLKFAMPPGTSPLSDQGWALLFPDPKRPQRPGSTDLTLTGVPLKPGKLTLPSLAIEDSAGKIIARTNPWTVEVASAIASSDPAPTKPAALRPPVDLAYPWWFVVLIGVAVILALIFMIWLLARWSRRFRQKKPPEPEKPPRPEDEIALDALSRLEKSGILKGGEFKKHYFGVSEILKTYFGARFGFDAPESTTREMLAVLEGPVSAAPLSKLSGLFEQLDLVKFTDHVPEAQEAETVVPVARELVLATRKPRVHAVR